MSLKPDVICRDRASCLRDNHFPCEGGTPGCTLVAHGRCNDKECKKCPECCQCKLSGVCLNSTRCRIALGDHFSCSSCSALSHGRNPKPCGHCVNCCLTRCSEKSE